MNANTRRLIATAAVAATALLGAAASFAQEVAPEDSRALQITSSTTRAAVIAQIGKATPRGEVEAASTGALPTMLASNTTRAAVKAETRRALAAHEVLITEEQFQIAPRAAARHASLGR